MNIRVGWIGLGIMGRPMALNLLRAGYSLEVYARRHEAAVPLAEAGATSRASPAEVARHADICFTMVSDTIDVEQVILGADASSQAPLVEGLQPGSLVVDMSTISPSATRRIAKRLADVGSGMLDAPVSGGEQGAIEGALSIMVGGSESAFERAKPLLDLLGRNIVHVGAQGAGQVCKACNQIVVGQTIVGVAEALLLAESSGVDGAKVREALLGGFAASRVLEVHGRRMLEESFEPGFKAALHCKDMRIVLETAHELGLALPGAAQVAQALNALVGRGDGELDSAALQRVLKALNSV